MNVLMIQPSQQLPIGNRSSLKSSANSGAAFQHVLANQSLENEVDFAALHAINPDEGESSLEDMVKAEIPEELLQFLEENGLYDSFLKQVELNFLSNFTEEKSQSFQSQESITDEDLLQTAYQFLVDHDYFNAYAEKVIHASMVMNSEGYSLQTNETNSLSLQQLHQKAIEVIQMISEKGDITKVAPKLTTLLQQWHNQVQALQQAKQQPIQPTHDQRFTQQTQLVQGGEQKSEATWNKLIMLSEQKFQQQPIQHTNAVKLTVNEVAQWLGSVLEMEKPIAVTQSSLQSLPLSKVEQFIIHINQSSSLQTADQQLIDKFQQIIQSNKLQNFWNGNSSLSFKLNPNQLGDMTIRLAQVNGEMSVKIFVSSMAAKEMLESNVNQLRNIFSPHQVIIEKQDTWNGTGNLQETKDNNQWQEHRSQSEQQTSEEDSESSSTDFQEFMEELLNDL